MQLIDQSKNAPTPLEQKRQSDVLRSNVLQIINRNRISLGSTQDAPGFARMNVALNDQSNLPIVNLSSPHFGNILFNQVADTATYAKVNATALTNGNIDISKSTPGSSGAGIINADSSNLGDSAGWHNTGVWGQVNSTPTTIGGYNITDAQSVLANASDTGQILYRDNGGTPYFAAKYGTEMNLGYWELNNITTSSTSFTQWGETVGISNPGKPVFIIGECSGNVQYNAAALTGRIRADLSVDGGSTWHTGVGVLASVTSGEQRTPFSTVAAATGNAAGVVTPTGDIQLRIMIANSAASATDYQNGVMRLYVFPQANYYFTSGALSATIPSTESGNCSAYYPITTCTTTNNIMVTPTGGTPPYTYSWAKVSGTGTLSNTTSQTVTITDTETTSDAGATHNTVVNCTVTDSAGTPASVTTSNCTATNTFTRLYHPVSVTVSTTSLSCWSTCGTLCTSTGTATASASGGDGSYTYAWTITSGPGSIISGATSQTCNLSYTHASSHPATTFSTVVKCVVTDGHSSSGNASGTVVFKFQCPA